MAWHRAAAADEVPEGGVIEVMLAGTPIALYRLDGAFYATHNICTHAFARLSEGSVDADTIECPLHQGVFDIRTGEPLEGPVDEPIATYAVKVEDGAVYVAL